MNLPAAAMHDGDQVDVVLANRIPTALMALWLVVLCIVGSTHPDPDLAWSAFCGLGAAYLGFRVLVPPVILRMDQETLEVRFVGRVAWRDVAGVFQYEHRGLNMIGIALDDPSISGAKLGLRLQMHRAIGRLTGQPPIGLPTWYLAPRASEIEALINRRLDQSRAARE